MNRRIAASKIQWKYPIKKGSSQNHTKNAQRLNKVISTIPTIGVIHITAETFWGSSWEEYIGINVVKLNTNVYTLTATAKIILYEKYAFTFSSSLIKPELLLPI